MISQSKNPLKALQIIAPTIEERIEARKSYQDKNHVKYANVEAVLSRIEGNTIVKEHKFGSNIVTTDGDIYYTIKGAGGTPATNENFLQGRLVFRTSAATPAKGDTYTSVTGAQSTTNHTIDAGYPKQNDLDTDNTGRGTTAVSYRHSYFTSEGNVNGIVGGCIVDNASPSGTSKILCHFTIASFDKTNSDTLKFFTNHTNLGA